MLLLAFPALEGSLCCLGSGDWPLDPHEILLHPEDLEKLRVPAFGYVAIHLTNGGNNGNANGIGGGSRSSGHRRPRSKIGRGRETEQDDAPPARREESEEPLTFCRAVPDGSLAPGETRAPAWILGAAGVRPRQHLLVHRPPEIPAGEGMTVPGAPAGGRQHNPSNFRVSLSFASEKQRQLVGDGGKDTTAQSGYGASSNPDIKARAIARRVSGCMVGIGSLLAAEVLGETVVLRVVAVSDRREGDDNGSKGNTNNVDAAVDADACPLQKNFVITSPSQVAFVGADKTEERGGSLLPRSGVASSPMPPGSEPTRHRRPPTGREEGDGREGWARRAPGLEAALTELQDLVLLSVGGVGAGSSGSSSCWKDVLPAGIAVCGPSGVGKTLALDILTDNLREVHGVHVVRLLGPQILAGVGPAAGGGSGGGGDRDGDGTGEQVASPLLQGPLGLSLADARARAPSVIVLDELDALFDACGGEDEGGGADPLGEGLRANAALLELLDRTRAMEGVTVLGATRRSPSGNGGAGWTTERETGGGGGGDVGDGAPLPAAFRKPGRFDRCVAVGPPTQAQRERILRVLLSSAEEGELGWELQPLEIAQSTDPQADGGAAPRGGVEAELEGPRTVEGRGSRISETHLAERARGSREAGRRSAREWPESADSQGRRGHTSVTREMGGTAAGTLAEWAKRLSSVTPGMVGGDLERLVRTARARSAQRTRNAEPAGTALAPPPLNTLSWQDAMGAVAVTVPRSLRGLDVVSSSNGGGDGGGGAPTWASVGGFSEAKRRLQRLVQWPWLHPEAFARMGVSAPAGALLYGPSGCGKSLVAQVLATECLANFLWVRSSELLSRYLGETEAKLRALFSRARAAAPCILFLDELDAITAKRGGGGGGGGEGGGGAGSVHARVLSTLLNEMDGVASTSASGGGGAVAATAAGGAGGAGAGGGVLVLAATNRRDALDAALLRPGRLHESVELGVPAREDREGVLRVHAGRLPLARGVDLARLSEDDVSGGLTCADLEASCRDAAMMAVREDLHGAREVRPEHLRKALEDRMAGRLRTRRLTFSIGQRPS